MQEQETVDSTLAQELEDSMRSNIVIHKKPKLDPTKALGSMPQEVYSKEEYCSDSMLYLIMPLHEIAIPYGRQVTPKLLETIADTLVKKGDLKSSQVATDYPVVTHVQLDLWYSHYTMVEQLKIIEVYKPIKALSGWDLLRKKQTRSDHSASVKAVREFKADKADMFIGGEDTQGQPTSYRITPDRKAEINREGK